MILLRNLLTWIFVTLPTRIRDYRWEQEGIYVQIPPKGWD